LLLPVQLYDLYVGIRSIQFLFELLGVLLDQTLLQLKALDLFVSEGMGYCPFLHKKLNSFGLLSPLITFLTRVVNLKFLFALLVPVSCSFDLHFDAISFASERFPLHIRGFETVFQSLLLLVDLLDLPLHLFEVPLPRRQLALTLLPQQITCLHQVKQLLPRFVILLAVTIQHLLRPLQGHNFFQNPLLIRFYLPVRLILRAQHCLIPVNHSFLLRNLLRRLVQLPFELLVALAPYFHHLTCLLLQLLLKSFDLGSQFAQRQ
jgi:hypothetical protein